MAGPSILVKFLSDVTGLGKSVDEVGTKSQTAGQRMSGAFHGALSTLNATGILGPFGTALDGAMSGIDRMAGHAKETGAVLMGTGAAAAGLGMALQAAGSKDQAAHQQLQVAVEATGHSYEQYGSRVDEAIKHQAKFGNNSAETQTALQNLTQATHDPAKALDMLSEASDLAAAKHESLTTASTQLGLAYNGNARVLKQFGITLDSSKDKTTASHEAVAKLGQTLAGQASAQADTFTGKITGIKTSLENTVATIGQKYGPALTTVGAAMTGVGAAMEVGKAASDALKDSQLLLTIGIKAQEAATKIATATQAAFNLVMDANPIMLVVLAGIALIAAVVLMYEKVGWFHDFVNTAMHDIAVAFNWITDAAKAVFGWVEKNWPLLAGMLFGPFGLAVGAIIKYRDDILNALKAIPGEVEGIAKGMWDPIWHAFKAALNTMIDLWNKLGFTLPKVDAGPIHIGGETIHVPKVPHLAEGGLVTGTGLIYAHAGEAITPAAAVGRTAPAVHVENANFSTELDIETFLKRASWVAQTASI